MKTESKKKGEYECKVCNMTFSSKEEFDKHNSKEHKD